MSKIKIEIKSWLSGSVLFEYKKENNSIKDTLLKGIESHANLRGANLCDADLRGANLCGANLRDANLRDANLRDANLCGADLCGANLCGANLCDANLRDANLCGADLCGANLRDANLRDANLRDANLRDASLCGADLCGANLCGANLRDANLRDANLRDANLRDANLCGADLCGANLCGANLEPFKKDLFDVLLRAVPEIDNLKKSLLDGKIDGSTYDGECACLCGTLEKSNSKEIRQRICDLRDSSRPIERFFMLINPGDTPENNEAAKIVIKWIEEFEQLINPVK
jgi:uncharacterized protein YjbI with pentapeptide repeats